MNEHAAGMAVASPPTQAAHREVPEGQIASDSIEQVVNIVDDDPDVCRSLKLVLQAAGYRVATYSSAREFLSADAASKPGCLILDIRLPGTNGLELQERLAALGSSMPVIIISGYADVSLAVRVMRRGAIDLLEKPFDSSIILDRVRQAVEIDRETQSRKSEVDQVQSRIDLLTPREGEVMRLVVEGYANKRIAAALGISMKTVEAHRAHVMRKMKADSLADLVKKVQLVQGERTTAGPARHSVN